MGGYLHDLDVDIADGTRFQEWLGEQGNSTRPAPMGHVAALPVGDELLPATFLDVQRLQDPPSLPRADERPADLLQAADLFERTVVVEEPTECGRDREGASVGLRES
jgi:hypothetical protein